MNCPLNGPLNGFPFTCCHREKVISHTDNQGVYHCGFECDLLKQEGETNVGCCPSTCPYIKKEVVK